MASNYLYFLLTLINNTMNTVDRLYSEQLFFFEKMNSDKKLFGVKYLPFKPGPIAFLMLQPIGTERNVIDALQINLARSLAANGISVLRFDYYGTGDSDGSFDEIDLETLMSDIDSAINQVTNIQGAARLGLFGLRFGGLLSAYYAEQHPKNVEYLILCAPVVDAFRFINQELRQSISTQSVLFQKVILNRDQILQKINNNESTVINGYDMANLNGFPLSHGFMNSLKDINLTANQTAYRNNLCIIDIDKRVRAKSKDISLLEDKYKACKALKYYGLVEKTIPWIHGDYLMKICEQLNNKVQEWVKEVSGKDM